MDTDYENRFNNLIAWTKERFPIQDIQYRWSGQVMEPKGSLSFIGHNPGDAKNIYIATGDSGNGMTHGTIAGILLSDMILGKENIWANLYDPFRNTTGSNSSSNNTSGGENKSESTAQQSTEGKEEEEQQNPKQQHSKAFIDKELTSSQGKIIESTGNSNKDPFAVFKDEKGELHTYSAKCTHLGCTIRWNSLEETFDCPYHGSRFAAKTGGVINGPAYINLKPNDLE